MSMTERAFREYESRTPYDNDCLGCESLQRKYDQLADRLRERDDEVWRLCRILDENNINYEVEDD